MSQARRAPRPPGEQKGAYSLRPVRSGPQVRCVREGGQAMGRRCAAEYWDVFATDEGLQWHLELARRAGPRALD